MENQVRISTLNVRGLKNYAKRIAVFQWIKDNKIDIAVLQETYCGKSFVKKFSKSWDGKVYHSPTDSNHSRGVCVLVNKNSSCKISDIQNDKEGRKIFLNININNIDYNLVNIYCPSKVAERINFLNTLINWTREKQTSENLIICGDFNCVDDKNDRVSKLTDRSSDALSELKKSLKTVDIWRQLNPNKLDYTFIDSSHRHSNSRIDMILISEQISQFVQTCEHEACCLM